MSTMKKTENKTFESWIKTNGEKYRNNRLVNIVAKKQTGKSVAELLAEING